MRKRLQIAVLVALVWVGAAGSVTWAQATDGQLNLVSQPGVEVFWEGVSLGETDDAGLLVIEGIPPGTYEVALRKSGYRNRTSRVEVTAGQRSLRLMLQRPPPPKPEPAPVEKRVEPAEPAQVKPEVPR